VTLTNAKGQGQVFYGMHFYPGVAQYDDPKEGSYRVFLNENTIRKMDPTFAGRPIFVEHVEEVEENIDQLRAEADGWVIESFYNAADGKHWVKFIIVTESAINAIKNGMRLSNAYIPKQMGNGGIWNGVSYDHEILDGEFEHLAIVSNPRYEESRILTPDQFKKHNEDKIIELKKLANSKPKGSKMKFNIFKKQPVEKDFDSSLMVTLPKSGKTISLQDLINNAYEKDQDEAMEKKLDGKDDSSGSHSMANLDHMVKMHDGSYMKLKDMMNKYKSINDDLDDLKKKKESEPKEKANEEEKELDLDTGEKSVDVEGDLHNDPDSEHELGDHEAEVSKEKHKAELKDSLEHPEEVVHDAENPAEDEEAKSKALELAEHEEKEIVEAKKKKEDSKKKNAKEKAEKLRNAHLNAFNLEQEPQTIELSFDRIKRGQERYGS